MHSRYLVLALASLVTIGSSLSIDQPSLVTRQSCLSANSTCDCKDTNSVDGGDYVCCDKRLGPKVLPTNLPLSSVLSDYDRFGGLTPGEFLKKYYYYNKGKGRWRYPDSPGFLNDTVGKKSISGNVTLPAGTLLDRFGAEETGRFLAPVDVPYSQRSLPPESLDTNSSAPDYPYEYHVYNVTHPTWFLTGPIAPGFGQPGLGTQFWTGTNSNSSVDRTISFLINHGNLAKVNLTTFKSAAKPCG